MPYLPFLQHVSTNPVKFEKHPLPSVPTSTANKPSTNKLREADSRSACKDNPCL
jgi:hypothetical protein